MPDRRAAPVAPRTTPRAATPPAKQRQVIAPAARHSVAPAVARKSIAPIVARTSGKRPGRNRRSVPPPTRSKPMAHPAAVSRPQVQRASVLPLHRGGNASGLIRVGVGDMAVSPAPAMIATYGLGSCIAVCAVDVQARVGGMLHFMLPKSTGTGAAARSADLGIPAFVKELIALGANPRNIRAKLVGGASVNQAIRMDIGKRNILAARKHLWKLRIAVDHEETGGEISRTVSMNVQDGMLRIRTPGQNERIL